MASNLILVLAASGLVAANVPATTATRASQALPASKVALVQATPAKLPVGCFAPVSNGKLATITDFRKAKAKCENKANLAGSSGGFVVNPVSVAVTAVTTVASVVVANEAFPQTACVKTNSFSQC